MTWVQYQIHAAAEGAAAHRGQPGLSFPGDLYVVRQVDGLHHHLHFVVSVVPFAEHVQDEVNFCFCLQFDGIHMGIIA